jgi:Protein of Unknown function (DUF2784)
VRYQLLATATMVVHFAFLAYVVTGGFLAWRWPHTIWLHLAMAGWGFSTVAFGWHCPLTYVEDWARRRAGEHGLATGFIDTYLEGVVYPQRFAGLMQLLAGVAVVTSWIGYAILQARRPRRRARSRSAS